MQKIEVDTSNYAIASAPDILSTSGIGSCVAICLYQKERKCGALLHIMLPRAEKDGLNPLRFADTALSTVLVELSKQNITKEQLVAKVVGGAQMFKNATSENSIGARNVAEVRLLLTSVNIAIMAEDVGGTNGRSLEFNLETGGVTISSKK